MRPAAVLLVVALAAPGVATFRNHLGTWTVRRGFVTRLVSPGGTVLTDNAHPPRRLLAPPDSMQDPAHGGIGQFGYKYAIGPPTGWTLWATVGARAFSSRDGEVPASKPQITATSWRQVFRFREGFHVQVAWTFGRAVVQERLVIRTRPGLNWVEEPMVKLDLNGPHVHRDLVVPGCRRLHVRKGGDPRAWTLHCTSPRRRVVLLGPLRFDVQDQGLRLLGHAAGRWPVAGAGYCGWRRALWPEWEYATWGAGRGTQVSLVAWGGCVGPADAPFTERLVSSTDIYRVTVTIRAR